MIAYPSYGVERSTDYRQFEKVVLKIGAYRVAKAYMKVLSPIQSRIHGCGAMLDTRERHLGRQYEDGETHDASVAKLKTRACNIRGHAAACVRYLRATGPVNTHISH